MDADVELATLSSLLDLDEFEVVESSWDRRERVRRLTLVPKAIVGLCPHCRGVTDERHACHDRIVADLPMGGQRVELAARLSQFHCRSCEKYFTPRFAALAEGAHASERLLERLAELAGHSDVATAARFFGIPEKTAEGWYYQYLERKHKEPAARLVQQADGHAQAGTGFRSLDELPGDLRRMEDHPLAGAGDVGEDTMLNGIVLRAVRRIVGHAQFQPQAARQTLQVFLEKVMPGAVASAPVTQDQQAFGLRVGRCAVFFPSKGDAVAAEFTGVVGAVNSSSNRRKLTGSAGRVSVRGRRPPLFFGPGQPLDPPVRPTPAGPAESSWDRTRRSGRRTPRPHVRVWPPPPRRTAADLSPTANRTTVSSSTQHRRGRRPCHFS